jgi:hypothetical protein
MFKRTGGPVLNRWRVSHVPKQHALGVLLFAGFAGQPVRSFQTSSFFSPQSRPIIPAAYTDVYTNQWISSAMICSVSPWSDLPWLVESIDPSQDPLPQIGLIDADCRYASVRLGGIVRSCSGRGCLNSCLFAIGICGLFFKKKMGLGRQYFANANWTSHLVARSRTPFTLFSPGNLAPLICSPYLTFWHIRSLFYY